MNGQFPSILLEKAVNEFAKLPGVGRKTAMRLVLHLLRQDTAVVEAFGNAIVTLKHEVKYCKVCHNISDTETCRICSNPQRDSSVICVVENIRDVMAVEATQQFRGLYHVLGGVISPMDGIGPGDISKIFVHNEEFSLSLPVNRRTLSMNGQFPSILLEKAVNEFAKLPGVGRKTAMRLVLHLLRQDTAVVEAFGNAIVTLKHEVKYCKVCHNISDTETCRICSNPQRDSSVICVVENIRDVMAVEATQQFRGLYHVLGGVISPMDGIGPGDLEIESLVQRVSAGGIKEVVLALSTTMEGDTTNFYIYRKLEKLGVKLSVIARGISVGDELEYADEVTLGRSIVNRTPFTGTV